MASLPHGTSSIQNFRLLASLNDCPIYLRPSSSITHHHHHHHLHSTGNSSILLSNTGAQANSLSASQTLSSNGNNRPKVQTTNLGYDEHHTDSIMFECLKRKPIDQLMQRVQLPMELMQLNPVTGEIITQTNQVLPTLNNQQESLTNENLSTLDSLALIIMNGFSGRTETPTLSSLFRPLFGPNIDLLTVPVNGDDLASMMLNSMDQFGSADLLAGLSFESPIPTIEHNSLDKHSSNIETSLKKIDRKLQSSLAHKNPVHVFAEKLSALDGQLGLTHKQADELVRAFVRAFYRYHDREIMNSLISNYLWQASITSSENNQRQQNLHLLESLMLAFQDSLINVPLIRTVLIHATHQLTPISQHISHRLIRLLNITQPGDENLSQLDLKSIAQSFTEEILKRSDVNDPHTDLYHDPFEFSARKQLSATYLYQFDPSNLFKSIQQSIDALNEKFSRNNPSWFMIKDPLDMMLTQMKSDNFPLKLGFSCSLESFDFDEAEYHKNLTESSYIAIKFNDWLCSTMASVVNDFATRGRISLSAKPQMSENNLSQLRGMNDDWYHESVLKLDHLTKYCSHNSSENQRIAKEIDVERVKKRCDINDLALEMIVHEFMIPQGNLHDTHHVRMFNQISREVAVLPSAKNIWNMKKIKDDGQELEHRSSFASRANYWLNNLPTLNCTKTQALGQTSDQIGLNEILGGYSPLLDLNLIFRCHIGPQTSYDIIQSHVSNIQQTVLRSREQQMNMMKLQSSSKMSSTTTNNLIPRMANQSSDETFNITLEQPYSSTNHPQEYTNTSSGNNSIMSDAKSNSLLLVLGCSLALSSLFSLVILIRHRHKHRVRAKAGSTSLEPEADQGKSDAINFTNDLNLGQEYGETTVETMMNRPDSVIPLTGDNQRIFSIERSRLNTSNCLEGQELIVQSMNGNSQDITKSSSNDHIVESIWNNQESGNSKNSDEYHQKKGHICAAHSSHSIQDHGNQILVPTWTDHSDHIIAQVSNYQSGTLDRPSNLQRGSPSFFTDTTCIIDPNTVVTFAPNPVDCSPGIEMNEASTGPRKRHTKMKDQLNRVYDSNRRTLAGPEQNQRVGSHLLFNDTNNPSIGYCPIHASQNNLANQTTGYLTLNGSLLMQSSQGRQPDNLIDSQNDSRDLREFWTASDRMMRKSESYDHGSIHNNMNQSSSVNQARFSGDEFIVLQPAEDTRLDHCDGANGSVPIYHNYTTQMPY